MFSCSTLTRLEFYSAPDAHYKASIYTDNQIQGIIFAIKGQGPVCTCTAPSDAGRSLRAVTARKARKHLEDAWPLKYISLYVAAEVAQLQFFDGRGSAARAFSNQQKRVKHYSTPRAITSQKTAIEHCNNGLYGLAKLKFWSVPAGTRCT